MISGQDEGKIPMGARIVPFEPRFHDQCEALIAALPDWFGIPEANASFLRNLSLLPSWVALLPSQVAGAITLEQHFPSAFEVHFMAVHPDHHRRGIGRMLLKHVEDVARSSGGLWLHVKTIGLSHPDPFYARTRAFYTAMGFAPLFESTTLWGERNPALVSVKRL